MRTQVAGLMLTALCLMPAAAPGQDSAGSFALQRQRAARELDAVISDTARLADKSSYVKVRARAANLLWPRDRERAGAMFTELWGWIDRQDDKGFAKEDARAVLLANLFPRDAVFAKGLLATLRAEGKEGLNSKRLNRLASELLEFDSAVTAELLTESVAARPSPDALPVLSKLRDKDAARADAVAERLLAALASQPADAALQTLYALNYYVFPAGGNVGEAAAPPPANESLRRRYFTSSYAALTQSLQEERRAPQNNAAAGARQSPSFFQVQMAELLSALSGRYAPSRAPEIQTTAAQVTAGASPEFLQVAQAMLRRVNAGASPASPDYGFRSPASSPGAEVVSALAVNDFVGAERLLNEVESAPVRRDLGRMIVAAEFKHHLTRGDVVEAFNRAQSADNPDAMISMFAQVAAATMKRPGDPSSAQLLASASAAIRKADCTPLKAKSMLSLAFTFSPVSAADGTEWLRGGTACVNSLAASASKKEGAGVMPAGEQELGQAFYAVGKIDLDSALLVANTLDDSFAQFTARLSACETWLNAPEERPSPASVKSRVARAKSQ